MEQTYKHWPENDIIFASYWTRAGEVFSVHFMPWWMSCPPLTFTTAPYTSWTSHWNITPCFLFSGAMLLSVQTAVRPPVSAISPFSRSNFQASTTLVGFSRVGGWRRLQGWNISPRARSTLISQVLAGTSPRRVCLPCYHTVLHNSVFPWDGLSRLRNAYIINSYVQCFQLHVQTLSYRLFYVSFPYSLHLALSFIWPLG
jgi:hypothetical protein